jgi:hypothetical protein
MENILSMRLNIIKEASLSHLKPEKRGERGGKEDLGREEVGRSFTHALALDLIASSVPGTLFPWMVPCSTCEMLFLMNTPH